MKSLLSVLALLSGALVHAQNVRVTKVSGKKAIVVRESGPPLKVGMLLTGGGDNFSESDLEGMGSSRTSTHAAGDRNNTIGGSASVSSSSTDNSGTSTSSTSLNFSAYYGWNKKQIEYGPRLNMRYLSSSSGSSSSSSTSFGFGGFFDYNFSPNVPGKELLYAAGATLDYMNSSASGGGSSTSTIELFVGPAIKWFPLGNSVAIRGDGGLNYARASADSKTSTTTTFLVRAGLQVYF